MPDKDENSQPVYFLDLIVENVRCFGKKQVLDLVRRQRTSCSMDDYFGE